MDIVEAWRTAGPRGVIVHRRVGYGGTEEDCRIELERVGEAIGSMALRGSATITVGLALSTGWEVEKRSPREWMLCTFEIDRWMVFQIHHGDPGQCTRKNVTHVRVREVLEQ